MEQRALYQTICGQLEAGRNVRIATVIEEDKLKERFLIPDSSSEAPSDADHPSDRIYTETIRPVARLLILGGGHVARCLAEFASKCDFKVWVADDRAEYACRSRFETADRILNASFEENILKMHLTSQDYVVVMTRGHHYDKICLRTILEGDRPGWIGVMGSRSRAALMRQMLLEEAYDPESVDQIHMPVGLKIGSVTPPEIAVSILAELISERHVRAGQCSDPSEAEESILRQMMSKEAYVEAVVLKTSGSAPRKNGARMIVWPDGQISGSIGGGLAEAKAIQKAMKMMGSEETAVIDVQMTHIPDNLHEEEMFCGGDMKVLLCAVKKLSYRSPESSVININDKKRSAGQAPE